jgi:hypothetical protein
MDGIHYKRREDEQNGLQIWSRFYFCSLPDRRCLDADGSVPSRISFIHKIRSHDGKRIVLLLTKQFLLWVVLANIIAWPVAYLAIRNWLDNYPFRTSLGLSIFLLSASAAFLITMLTVGFQAVRAALANPADSLRYE